MCAQPFGADLDATKRNHLVWSSLMRVGAKYTTRVQRTWDMCWEAYQNYIHSEDHEKSLVYDQSIKALHKAQTAEISRV